jgi:putative nucleotidyltransferase with HDIG domain
VTTPIKPKITVKSIELTEVLKWTTTPYNLYIKLPDGRFLAVVRRAGEVDHERLRKYLAKGVTTLFASEQELVDVVGAEVTANDFTKLAALEKVSDAVFDELRVLGVTEASFNHAKAIGKAVRGFIDREPQLSTAFQKFQTMNREDVRHSLMVSALSTVIASSMEWVKPATVENVAMGGLLHDFGKFTLPREILDTPLMSLTPNDRKILDGHAEAGRALLAQVKTVPEDIQMIVAHHHERSDGSGYPLGLKDFYIHPLARVVGLANELVEQHEAEMRDGRTTSIRRLVETLISSQASKFNRDLIKSLKSLLDSDILAK